MDTDKPKDAAEPTPASAGSVQPLAWAVVCPTGEPLTVRWTWHECLDVAGPADEIIPLYRQPKPTLTDAEREAVWTVAEAYAENDGDPECERIARVMQGLWQRTK